MLAKELLPGADTCYVKGRKGKQHHVALNHALCHSLCQHSHSSAVGVQHHADVISVIVLGSSLPERQAGIVHQNCYLAHNHHSLQVLRCSQSIGEDKYAAIE